MAANFTIFIFLLVGRVLDVSSTYAVTPNLKLELNPIVRRLGWRYAWATLFIAFLAFPYPNLGIILSVVSYLAAVFNMNQANMSSVIGETELKRIRDYVMLNISMKKFMLNIFLSLMCFVMLSILIMYSQGTIRMSNTTDIAEGVLGYAILKISLVFLSFAKKTS